MPINARVITATNKDIENLVKEGKFREDLYFRLNVIRIEVPPLRERKEDIPLLISFFIEKFNQMMGKSIKKLELEAINFLQNYTFPGNIRELENIIERAFIYSENETINLKNLAMKIENQVKNNKTGKIKDMENQAIIDALQKWEGN